MVQPVVMTDSASSVVDEESPKARALAFLRELAPEEQIAQRRAVTTLLRALLADRGIR